MKKQAPSKKISLILQGLWALGLLGTEQTITASEQAVEKTEQKIPAKSAKKTASKKDVKNKIVEKKIQDKTDFYTLEASYPSDPRDTNKDIETFVTTVVNKTKEEWKTGGEDWKFWEDAYKEDPTTIKGGYIMKISYTSTPSPRLGTVSHVLIEWYYTRGAHGNSTIHTYTFTDDGKRLALDSLLNLGENHNDVALSQLMLDKLLVSLTTSTEGEYVEKIKASLKLGFGLYCFKDGKTFKSGLTQHYLKDGETLDLAKISSNVKSNFTHFIVTDQGIIFKMDEFKVVPYDNAMPEVLLSWEELAPYLTDFAKEKLAQS